MLLSILLERNLERPSNARRRPTAPPALLCFFCALSLFCVAAQAQSGRRLPPPKKDPPVPVAVETPQPVKPKEEAKKIPVLVLFDHAPTMHISISLIGTVRDVFVRRLRDARALEVSAEETNHGSGEARKRAKSETERHVVWVSLVASPFYSDPLGTNRPRTDEMHVQYSIYQPVTGKITANGNVYLRPNYGRVGRTGLPGCYPSIYIHDYEFVEAAIEAGNRVIKEFNLPLPPVCN